MPDPAVPGGAGTVATFGPTQALSFFSHNEEVGPREDREVVHDDDVANPQLRHQNLRHIGFEPVAVYRPVQHHRRDHAGRAKARDHSGGFAMAVREAHPQSLAFPTATVTAGHIGGGPSYIDKHEGVRVRGRSGRRTSANVCRIMKR